MGKKEKKKQHTKKKQTKKQRPSKRQESTLKYSCVRRTERRLAWFHMVRDELEYTVWATLHADASMTK